MLARLGGAVVAGAWGCLTTTGLMTWYVGHDKEILGSSIIGI